MTAGSSPRSAHGFIGPIQPHYMRLPSHVQPTCTFDQIYIDFINAARSQIARGFSADNLLGPEYPDVTSLVKPEVAEGTQYHELSNLLGNSMKGFSDIQSLPTKIGYVGNSFWLTKWLVHPSEERYNQIPLHCRPTEEQLTFPHPIWIDFIQWYDSSHIFCPICFNLLPTRIEIPSSKSVLVIAC